MLSHKQLFITAFFIFCFSLIYSQNIIKGRVTDEQNNPVFLCLVYTEHAHTYTNENGAFEIKIHPDDTYIKFHYLGFKTDSIFVNINNTFVEIKLKSNFFSLNEITVVSGKIKNSYNLLYESKLTLEKMNKTLRAKAFFELITYEINQSDTIPVESFRSFYNVRLTSFGFEEPEIYAGQFLLPENHYFLNFASIHLLKKFHLTQDSHIFPHQPYYCESKQHLKNIYKLRLDDIQTTDNDTVVQISFTPFENDPDSALYFKGYVLYNLSKKQVERLSLFNKGFKRHGMISIHNPRTDTIRLKQTEMQIIFKDNRIDFINYRLSFDFYTLKKWHHFITVMKFHVPEKKSIFPTPLFPDYYENISDYHKLYILPHNEKVFEKYNLMKPGSESENVLNRLKKMKYIDSKTKIKTPEKINRDVQVIGKNNTFSYYQFKHQNMYNKNLPVISKNLTNNDSIFLFSFPVLNINEEEKSITITPVMDIGNSFIVHEKKFGYMDHYIKEINRFIEEKQKEVTYEALLNGDLDLKKFYKELEDEYYRLVLFLNIKANKL